MDLVRNATVDLDILGERLSFWFVERSWNIQADVNPTHYIIQASKAGKVRIFFAACRTLVVICRHDEGKTLVSVRQGRWTKNIWSNLAWFVGTGGTNLAFTLWSLEVQREFQNFAKGILDGM